MTWLRRWLLGDLLERVETLEAWARHHDAPKPRPRRLLSEEIARELQQQHFAHLCGPRGH